MQKKEYSIWGLLIFPPLFFLINIVVFSLYFGANGVFTNEEISNRINDNIPILLLLSQTQMYLLALIYAKQFKVHIFKATFKSDKYKRDIILGLFIGITIALLYKFVVADLLVLLQNSIGDYVPTNSLNNLKQNLLIFGISNVILAPFVEENIYRNIALGKLQSKYGNYWAIIISSIFFGLLHWLGGLWYMLATLLFVGIPFAIISVKRKSIFLVYIAHLTLNFLEFLM